MSSTKSIYFHIDECSRDSIVASGLYWEFKRKGYRLYFGNRFSTSLLNRLTRGSCSFFDVVIVPRPHFITAFRRSTAVVCILYTECIGRAVSHSNPKLTSYVLLDKAYVEGDQDEVERVDRFLCWGQSSKDFIAAHYPALNSRFQVVGHPRFDEKCQQNTIVRSKIDTRRCIGLVTRQCLMNDFHGRAPRDLVVQNILTSPYVYIDPESGKPVPDQDNELPERLYMESREIEIYLDLVARLSKEGYKVVVRVHPREDRLFWPSVAKRYGLNISLSPWDEPYAHFLSSVDAVISPASTTTYDATRFGVPVVLTNNIDPFFKKLIHYSAEDNNPFMQSFWSPRSIDVLLSGLEALLLEGGLIEVEIDRLLSYEAHMPKARSSFENIVEEVLDVEPKDSTRIQRVFHFAARSLLFSTSLVGYMQLLLHVLKGQKVQSSHFPLIPKRVKWIKSLCS